VNTFWLYGDSFAVDWGVDWSWPRLTAPALGVSRSVNQAQAGCANTYTLSRFRSDPHQPGDTVVVCVTESTRHWFIEQEPALANYQTILHSQESLQFQKQHPQQHSAIVSYYEQLQRTDLDDLALECQVSWLWDQALQRGVRLLLMPGFDHSLTRPHDAVQFKGSLNSVCMNEFVSDRDRIQWYNQGIDTRANHLSRVNHEILAAKIIAAVREGIPVDLTEGFHTGFLQAQHKHTHPGLLPQLVEQSRLAEPSHM